MDKPEILEIIIQQVSRCYLMIKSSPDTDPLHWNVRMCVVMIQLPVRTQLSCTLVSRQWYAIAHALIQRYHLARFEDQLDTLRCFTLNRCVHHHAWHACFIDRPYTLLKLTLIARSSLLCLSSQRPDACQHVRQTRPA